jgi:hypothetical protein
VTALTLGDYFLWNSSVDSGRDVIAIFSGLTLPLLAAIWLFLVGLTLVRSLTKGPRVESVQERSGAAARLAPQADPGNARTAAAAHVASPAGSPTSSGKLAA